MIKDDDPMARIEVNLYYPLTRDVDEINLGGLNLKWAVTLNGEPVTRSSAFERIVYWYASYPYYYGDGYLPLFCW